ncbi:MAG: GPW/gp25 family protein [Achromobacter pestifer]
MSYLGMNAKTGRRITGAEHLSQSIGKVIGTSVGTRQRRRPFGSVAPDLVDAPAHAATLLQLYAAAATALLAWEPRLTLRSITARVDAEAPGVLVFELSGEALVDNEVRPVSLSTRIGA